MSAWTKPVHVRRLRIVRRLSHQQAQTAASRQLMPKPETTTAVARQIGSASLYLP